MMRKMLFSPLKNHLKLLFVNPEINTKERSVAAAAEAAQNYLFVVWLACRKMALSVGHQSWELRKEKKKTRKQAFDQESDQEKKKKRLRKRKNFLIFLIESVTFSFLTFLFSFLSSQL